MERLASLSFGRGLRAALLAACLALGSVGAVTASAAAPVAQDDTLSASPTGALDVMANDSGDPADSLRVVSNTQPAHGTATCSALGACLYRVSGSYTGPDSFTYTVRDGSAAEATATVSVDVGAAPAGGAPIARDDDTATLAGRAVTVDVLANDAGTGLTVTSHGQGTHGAVECTDAGSCTYTPAAGFTGTDGFTYAVADGASRTSDAAVHVIVAPGDTSYRIGVGGQARTPVGGAVAGGGLADWTAQIAAMPSGLSGQALGAIARPTATTQLGGPHVLAGDPVGARGWKTSVTGGSVAFAATQDALLGDAVTRTFPRPLPPISQGSGGDGHVPILVGSKVFAFFHHSSPTQVTCVDRATGQLCPGYPKSLNMSTSNIPGPAAVVGTKIYVHLLPGNSYTQTAPIAVFCWDAATDSTCGLTILDRMTQGQNPGASATVLAAGKVWLGGDTGKLYCLDPATGEACPAASITTGQGTASSVGLYDIVAHGSRVFLSRSDGQTACADIVSAGRCPGWDTPKSFDASSWNLVTQHDAAGAAVGVCIFHVASSPNVGRCIRDADPATETAVTNYVANEPYAQGYGVTSEAETGTRTLVPSLYDRGLGCYDWTTMAPCTGGGYESDGWLRKDDNGASLPSAYGAVYDGSCVVALGDPGQVYTVDPAGASPCLSLNSGADRVNVDLRDQRCDKAIGAATWKDVRLTDVKPGEFDSVRAVVRDAATQAVLADEDLVAHDGVLNLSGIDPRAHPALTVDATAKRSSGGQNVASERLRVNATSASVVADPWSDGIPPRLTIDWNSDPAPLCVTTTADQQCSAAAPAPISLIGHLTSPVDATAQAQLSTLRGTCPAVQQQSASTTKPKAQPHSCAGRRRFLIHIRFRGSDIEKLTVKVGSKRQEVLRLTPRPVVRIDLSKLPRKTVRVGVTIKTKAGKTLTGRRVYHPCHKVLQGTGFKFREATA